MGSPAPFRPEDFLRLIPEFIPQDQYDAGQQRSVCVEHNLAQGDHHDQQQKRSQVQPGSPQGRNPVAAPVPGFDRRMVSFTG